MWHLHTVVPVCHVMSVSPAHLHNEGPVSAGYGNSHSSPKVRLLAADRSPSSQQPQVTLASAVFPLSIHCCNLFAYICTKVLMQLGPLCPCYIPPSCLLFHVGFSLSCVLFLHCPCITLAFTAVAVACGSFVIVLAQVIDAQIFNCTWLCEQLFHDMQHRSRSATRTYHSMYSALAVP